MTAPGGSAVTQFITLAFNTLLDRAPDSGDLARWNSALATGTLDARSLVQALLGSAEYQSVHAGESDEAFLSALYRSAHAEEIDPTLLSQWVELLSSQAVDKADAVLVLGLAHHGDDALPGR
ncbi:DUF4214 domain-containing protein [Roseomonas sp. GC11]|nr:DUF4214 domain-containing protein [Roseomonas sp. GC11]